MKVLSLAVICLVGMGVPAHAADTSHVSFADLDLATATGQARLDRRIALAADVACGTASSSDLKGQNMVTRCRHEAIADAAAQRHRVVDAARTPVVASTSR